MKRFIITGAPGAGKTTILRQLEVDGFSVVEEAVTDLIALWQAQGISEPWMRPEFLDAVVRLQRQRLERSSRSPHLQFHDRSAICTAALATYLGYPFTDLLNKEVERIRHERLFEKQVLFIRNLGFVAPTAARRISYEESLRFEQIHEDLYTSLGYSVVPIAARPLADRVAAVRAAVAGATD